MVGLVGEWWLRLLIGLVGSSAVGLLAYQLRALSGSGALAAAVMGTGFVTLGEPVWFGILIVFFVSSTLWSKWKKRHRAKQEAEAKYAKSGRRDAGQVWANGGIGLLLCVGNALFANPAWLLAYIGVMASANADTWATEIGALSKSAPRSVLTGKTVRTGTSGGITLLGSLASLSGAVLIGIAGGILLAIPQHELFSLPFSLPLPVLSENTLIVTGVLALIGGVAGFAGAFVDSLLGAGLQAQYHCDICQSDTERTVCCGKPTRLVRGFAWLTNDRVNMLSTIAAGVIACLLGYWLYL